jgi:hypothetical protein
MESGSVCDGRLSRRHGGRGSGTAGGPQADRLSSLTRPYGGLLTSACAVAQGSRVQRCTQPYGDRERGQDGSHARAAVGSGRAPGADGDHHRVRALVHVHGSHRVTRQTAEADLEPERAPVGSQQPPWDRVRADGLRAAAGDGECDQREGAPRGAPSKRLNLSAQR